MRTTQEVETEAAEGEASESLLRSLLHDLQLREVVGGDEKVLEPISQEAGKAALWPLRVTGDHLLRLVSERHRPHAMLIPSSQSKFHISAALHMTDGLVHRRRHATLLSRLRTLAPNPTNAEIAVKAAVRSFRASESTSRDLISTVWSVLDRNLDNTATIINLLVDLFDDEEKKSDLLGAWNGFKIEVSFNFRGISW